MLVRPWACINISNPSTIRLKVKSRDIFFIHSIFHSCPITLKFCTKHDNNTAMRCAKLLSEWTTEKCFMDEQDLAIFQFKMDFDRSGFIDTGPRTTLKSKLIYRAKLDQCTLYLGCWSSITKDYQNVCNQYRVLLQPLVIFI